MIGVYTKRMRSLNEEGKKVVTAWMDVGFREYVHKLKGARLAVFLVIALHTDENGWAFPSVKLLTKETGYSQDTVNDALNTLCSMTINGHRLLLRFQPKRDNGQFKSNRYLIFPSVQEQREYAETGIKHLGHKTGNGYDKRPPPRKEVETTVMGFSGKPPSEPSRDSPMTKNHHVKDKNHHTTQSVPVENITTKSNVEAKEGAIPNNVEHQAGTDVEPKPVYITLPDGSYVTPEEIAGTPNVEDAKLTGHLLSESTELLEEPIAPNVEQEPDLAPDGYPVRSEDFWPPQTHPPRVQRTEVERQAVIMRAMDKFQRKHSVGGEAEISPTWRNVPPAQGVILTCFHRLSGMAEPVTKSRRESASYAAEVLYKEIGSAGDVVKRLNMFFAERAKGEKYQFDIVSLHSLVNTICAMQSQAAGPKIIRVGG